MDRYARTNLIKGGIGLSTTRAIPLIRKMIEFKQLRTYDHISREGERLDHIAARKLGSSQLWWVLAVCSDIGWALQIPPGTVVKIPADLGQIAGAVT